MTILTRNRTAPGTAGTLRATVFASLAAAFLLAFAAPVNPASAADEDIRLYRFSTPADAEMDHFVGAVDDELFVGIALSEAAAAADEPRTLVVYLCDGRSVSKWMVEEAAGEQATVAHGDTRVELAIAEAGISGTVALDGGEPQPFAAEPATGDAGLYRAEWSLAGADYMINWIVLADGSQRGSLDGKGNDLSIMVPW